MISLEEYKSIKTEVETILLNCSKCSYDDNINPYCATMQPEEYLEFKEYYIFLQPLLFWEQHKIKITHNPIPTPIPQYWSKYSKCLVCGEYHDNGNLPCLHSKFTSTV